MYTGRIAFEYEDFSDFEGVCINICNFYISAFSDAYFDPTSKTFVTDDLQAASFGICKNSST